MRDLGKQPFLFFICRTDLDDAHGDGHAADRLLEEAGLPRCMNCDDLVRAREEAHRGLRALHEVNSGVDWLAVIAVSGNGTQRIRTSEVV